MKEDDVQALQSLASQLREPHGEQGIKVAHMMNESNIEMTRACYRFLQVKENQNLLELGHGNAAHISEFLNTNKNLHYNGLEISNLMYEEAQKINSQWIKNSRAEFKLYDGHIMPYEDNFFDFVITINTVYFWKSPLETFKEIQRVLKKQGVFCMAFGAKDFMKTLPFIHYGFKLYDLQEILEFLERASFQGIVSEKGKDRATSKTEMDMFIERDFFIVRAHK